jgi:hypothetical protein
MLNFALTKRFNVKNLFLHSFEKKSASIIVEFVPLTMFFLLIDAAITIGYVPRLVLLLEFVDINIRSVFVLTWTEVSI